MSASSAHVFSPKRRDEVAPKHTLCAYLQREHTRWSRVSAGELRFGPFMLELIWGEHHLSWCSRSPLLAPSAAVGLGPTGTVRGRRFGGPPTGGRFDAAGLPPAGLPPVGLSGRGPPVFDLPARGLPEPRFPGGDAMGPASANCKDASETPSRMIAGARPRPQGQREHITFRCSNFSPWLRQGVGRHTDRRRPT